MSACILMAALPAASAIIGTAIAAALGAGCHCIEATKAAFLFLLFAFTASSRLATALAGGCYSIEATKPGLMAATL